ncbi:LysE/ArgO family amino acid transporter [Bacillus sp. SG-1]|uniref:LysE/ArgO family amino acid transporter n=1 Tax=Bacillus sp. SG-1 TaxID=161544 RepID=UPI0001543F2E|nr:LysE/ArgO family amino acid transporter [Bacillus sp. SG-1]EDL66411.1 transporter, LysE family protein [Bacillus sp. SG-1]
MISAIFHGVILAFGLILPLGVQNVFVFNQGSLQPKFSRTLPVVITASVCDTILISMAVLGVSILVLGIYWIKVVLLSAGIIFLLYMGLVTWNSKGDSASTEGKVLSPKRQIIFAASVSLLNPHAIMDTIGVIGTSSISYSGMEKFGFTAACIGVSWIWFLALAFLGKQIGSLRNAAAYLVMLNKVSALIIWGTAIYLLSNLLIF